MNNRERKKAKDVGTDDSDVLFHFLGLWSVDTYNKGKFLILTIMKFKFKKCMLIPISMILTALVVFFICYEQTPVA